jgi:sugar lactone lactonase YvrE
MRLLAIAAIAVLGAVLVASSAYAITLHPGDLVVARQRTPFFPSAVVHVDPLTGVRTVIVLLDNPGTPSAIAIDGNGDLLVAERSLAGSRAGGISIGDNDIVRIDPVTGAQSVVVLFPEEAGTIGVSPTGVAIDATGDLLVTYSQMSSFGVGGGVLRVDPLTGDVTEVSSGGILNEPTAIAIEANGDLMVVNLGVAGLPVILRIDPRTGAQSGVSSEGAIGSSSLAIDADGDLLVKAPRRFLPGVCMGGSNDGNVCTSGAECQSSEPQPVPRPRCVIPSPEDSILRVDPVTGAATVVSSGGLLTGPTGIAIDADGDLIVVTPSAIFHIDPVTGAQKTVSADASSLFSIAIVPDLQIAMDIKPGSDTNPINLFTRGAPDHPIRPFHVPGSPPRQLVACEPSTAKAAASAAWYQQRKRDSAAPNPIENSGFAGIVGREPWITRQRAPYL